MTEFQGMSWETFEKNKQAIAIGVNALLLDTPESRKSRKRWRRLAIYERDQLVAEVLDTQYGRLVVSRDFADDDPDRKHQDKLRAIEPFTGDPQQRFDITSRRARYRLRADDMMACIPAGTRKMRVSPTK